MPSFHPNLRIRVAAPGDESLLVELIRELAVYERLSEEVRATPALLAESLFANPSAPAAEAVIAEWDGSPAAFALYFYNFSTFLGRPGLYLEDLYVRETCRGRGIGKALLVYLARRALARDCGRMEWSVLDWNEPAIDFYRKLGAKPMSEWTLYRLDCDGIARLAGEGQTGHG